jgi:ATP-binding cassette subfamily B protein
MNYTLKTLEKGEGSATLIDAFKSLKPLLTDEKGSLFLALFAILVNSGANLLGPVIIAKVIDTYIVAKDFHGVLVYSGLLAVVYLFLVGAPRTVIRPNLPIEVFESLFCLSFCCVQFSLAKNHF